MRKKFDSPDAAASTTDRTARLAWAIDDNPGTWWHTQFEGDSPVPPHSLIVDMGKPAQISGFRMLPRQDKLPNGNIAKFRFFVSTNGVDWGQPVAEGDFSSMGPVEAEKTVRLK